jgi:hypothetical protein
VGTYIGTILSDVVAIDQPAEQLLSWGKPTLAEGAEPLMLNR